MTRFLRLCRTVHSWLGVIVMPWILIIGLTGFYLNHERLVFALMGQSDISGTTFAHLDETDITEAVIQPIVAAHWPDEQVLESGLSKYRDQRAWIAKKPSGAIIFPGPRSHHYFVRTTLSEYVYSLDGTLLHRQWNLKPILKSLHERGWIGTTLGTWLADTVAFAMVFFGLSGLIMWTVPKMRKLRTRLSRALPARQHG